jgi:hypothetical protein
MSIERGERVSYEDFRHLTENRENEVDMGQISPRMFEAASLGTPMILYEGRYSGVLEPWKHYIPLAKDFSNLEIVLSKISDVDYLTGLSARAYDDLIASGRFSYGKFVEEVDSVLDRVQSKIGAIERENRKTLVSDRLDLEHQEEYPTNTPRPVEYFLLRQEQRRGLAWRLYFERLISESQQASLMNVIIRPGSGLWRMGKRAWRLLPATLRYRLATMLLGSSARLDT